MRKIINSTYITLDGVVEAPQLWPSLGRTDDERAGQIQSELLLSCDAMLMGRHTYDGFAPVWPTRSGDPVSDQHERDAQVRGLHDVGGSASGTTRASSIGDVAGEIGRLKQEPGKDIVQFGFGSVSRLLLEHGLLDELRLWVHPLILGRGDASDLLFGAGEPVGFSLAGTTTLSNGIVILSYETSAKRGAYGARRTPARRARRACPRRPSRRSPSGGPAPSTAR